MTKLEKQFRAAMRQWDNDNPPAMEWTGQRNARRAAFAAFWFIENAADDDNGRTDVFFMVREIYRQSSAGNALRDRLARPL